jgi:four helix bundle protein
MSNKTYNLEERTSRFGETIIDLCKTIKQDIISRPIITQLIRSATSIGANYHEANGASSQKDFKNKIHIVQKEALESIHWLRMLKRYSSEKQKGIDILVKECHEFTLIFGKTIVTLNNKDM